MASGQGTPTASTQRCWAEKQPAGTVGQPVAGSAEAPALSQLRKLGCSSGCSLCTESIGAMALGAQELSYVGPETKN